MLYEKKMLILSGDGKGVVLIEKGGHGVTFSLRTFDMTGQGPFKAGIITRSSVHVRDLPSEPDPAAQFTVDVGDISELHFAVFDKRLRLYGTNTKRMWEANIMQLLDKHDRRESPVMLVPSAPPRRELDPISPKPRVLPMPDGTGIPQSRLSVYGDEALSESDIYTSLDFSSRMPQVDSFLDGPRVLDDIAPRLVVPPPNIPARELASDSDRSAHADRSVNAEQAEDVKPLTPDKQEEHDPIVETTAIVDDNAEESVETYENANDALADRTEEKSPREAQPASAPEQTDGDNAEQAESPVIAGQEDIRDVEAASAGTLYESDREMPWEITAKWLKNRTDRQLFVKREIVKKPHASDRVKYLRSSKFFERAHADIETLFAHGKKDEKLTKLLPDIDWVKVEFDGHSISVGKGDNAFLCYAVTGNYEKTSPIGDEAQWLPSDSGQPTGAGYWLIFQNLEDGTIISN